MRINNNLMAMNTYRQLGIGQANGAKSMEKLSSGLRINRAGDDAAGLAISEKMRGQIRGLTQASKNAQDGISMIQTAEGALQETHAILQRMRELAVQSANDTNVSVDRSEIQKEMDELAKEITRIANNTEFNTQKLINGGIDDSGIKAAKFHVGANSAQDITLSIKAMDAKSLGVSRDLTVVSGTGNGIIDSVTFDSSVGSKIVDGATITFSYSTAPGSPETPAEIVGGSVAVHTTDLSEINDGTSVTINVDGNNYVIDNAALKGIDGSGGINALLNAIENAKDGSNLLSGAADVTVNGDGQIVITSKSEGSTSNVTFTITDGASDTATLQTAFGITNGTTDTGEDAVNAYKQVTVSDGTASQVIDIADEAATTFSVTEGQFRGMTIELATGNAISNLNSATDNVVVSTVVEAATSAVFSGGALQTEARTEAGIDVSTQAAASGAITKIQTAIETVSAERSKLGAYQNRLEHTIKNLDTSAENLQAAESRIRDVDMAKEMMEFTKNNILQQAAQAMLAQANQAPQGVLQLLR